jgi:hypothetical protein
VSRDLARKGLRIWPRGSRGCEIGDIPTAGAVWAIAETGEWSTGGTKGSSREISLRSPEIFALGSASLEVPRSRDSCGRRVTKCRGAEILVDAWQSIRWDCASRGLVD